MQKKYNYDEDFYDDDSDIYESEFEHEHQYHEDGPDYDLNYGRAYNRPYDYQYRRVRSHHGVLRPKENRSGFFKSDD